MRIFIAFFLLFIATVAFSQTNNKIDSNNISFIKTPFNPTSNYKTWAIKGACLPVFIGNEFGVSSVLGLEYGFLKNQSLGIDFNYIYSGGSDDNVTDTAGIEHSIGNYASSNEAALFINYRYYFNWQKLRNKKRLSFYTSGYFRYSQINSSQDPAYKGNYLSQKEKNYSEGILLGLIRQFNYQRLGLDFNIGVFDKQKDIATIYEPNNVQNTGYEKSSNIGVRIGFTLNYFIFVKKL